MTGCVRIEARWARATESAEEREGAGGGASPAPSPAADAEAPRRRRHRRPLYRRLFSYVRTAWTGVKFALEAKAQNVDNSSLDM
ncbi:hypothetical protein JYU34_017207 [Plutella xylostella]|uniref:Uncharacterized protein n=1 Tax=Plutella xylostella TaxID=51655 RepID=A0ABQ7Q0W0_PLUXY|nr:hypothetical protein JYU34_017207 [Plutella xylostella]